LTTDSVSLESTLHRSPEPPPELIAAIKGSRAIAVVGSGLSRGAPSWPELLKRLIDSASAEHPSRATEIAAAQDRLHRQEFLGAANILKDLFGHGFKHRVAEQFRLPLKPTASHRLLARLPFCAFVTTNYDGLLEAVLPDITPYCWSYNGLPRLVQTRKKFILKLHGDVEHEAEIILARDDYWHVMNNRVLQSVLKQLSGGHTLFWIGYGHRDPHLDLILQAQAELGFSGGFSLGLEGEVAKKLGCDERNIALTELRSYEDEVELFLTKLVQATTETQRSEPETNHSSKRSRICMVPHRQNPYFIDAGSLLEKLKEVFVPGRPVAAVLHGLYGVGKTPLAVHYAHAQRDLYQASLWVNGDSLIELDRSLERLAGPEGLNLDPYGEGDQRRRIEQLRRWLLDNDQWLLLIDSADGPAARRAVNDWLDRNAAAGGHILITSRSSEWPASVVPLWIDSLSAEDGARLLLQRTSGRGVLGTDAEALEISVQLCGVPLALEQAAAYLVQTRKRFTDYLALLRVNAATAFSIPVEGTTRYERSVVVAWSTTEQALGPAARALLRVTAFLAPAALPRRVLLEHVHLLCDLLPEEQKLAARDSFEQGLLELGGYSLFELEPDTLRCHQLSALVQRAALSRQEEGQQCLERAIELFEAIAAPLKVENPVAWPVLESLQPHLAALVEHAETLDILPRAHALASTLADFVFAKGRYVGGELLLRRALASNEAALAPDDERVRASVSKLGRLLHVLGALKEAGEPLERAVGLAKITHGPEHPRVADELVHLARLRQSEEKLADAEDLLREALKYDEAVPEASQAAIARDRIELGAVLYAQGRFAEAKLFLETATMIGESSRDAAAQRATGLIALGNLLRETRQLSEAERYILEALEIDEDCWGRQHPNVARDLNALALLCLELGRLDKGISHSREALRITELSFGSNHPEVAIALNNLADLQRKLPESNDAQAALERALSIDEANFGPRHSLVARDLSKIAQVLFERKEFVQAERLMWRAFGIDAANHRPTHPAIAKRQCNLSALFHAQDQFGESEALIRCALSIDKEAHGPDHWEVVDDLRALARILEDRHSGDDLVEAERALERALEICERTKHQDEGRVGDIRRVLDRVRRRQRRAVRSIDA